MPYRKVSAGAGLRWMGHGWRLFALSPGMWIGVAVVFFLLLIGLNILPLLGGLIVTIITPALLGGLVYGARELDEGRRLEIGHLFQAFREPGRLGPMLGLGLVPLMAAVLVAAAGAMLLTGMATASAAPGPGGAPAGGGAVMFLVSSLIGLVAGALLLFSVPRVMFGLTDPTSALGESFRATLANLGPYLVFVVVYLVLAALAAIPLALGFLVLLPVVSGAVYAAHVEVFGAEAETATETSEPA
jgi:uncharacterized membrane protein